MNTIKLSRKAVLAIGATMAYLAPKLAQDAKVDLFPAFDGVDAKNLGAKKDAIVAGVTAAVEGKLAKDASLEDFGNLLDAVNGHGKGENGEDAYDEEKAPEAPAGGGEPEGGAKSGTEQACEFLKDKLSPEDYAMVEKMLKGAPAQDNGGPAPFPGKPNPGGAMDESPEAKAAREAAEKETRKATLAQDADVVALVDAAKAEATAAEAARFKAIRDAEAAVRPYVGEIAMDGISTGADVYRAAFKVLNIDVKDVHESAFPALLKTQKPATRPVAPLAQDGDTKPYSERFPEAGRLTAAG